MDTKIKEISRKQLFDEIWEISLAGVARKYDLNYSKLRNKCRDEDIPIPSSGYWTRKNMGKDVSGEKPILTGLIDKVVILSMSKETDKSDRKHYLPEKLTAVDDKSERIINEVIWDDNRIGFLDAEERNKVLIAASALTINNNLRLNRVLSKFKQADKEYRARKKKAEKENFNYHRSIRSNDEANLFKELSDEGVSRTLAILNTIIKEIEKLGGYVNDDLSMHIRMDDVAVHFAEGHDKVPHELTKEEAQAILKYEEEVKRYHWVSKPKIRKYDKVYNGKLRIVFGNGKYLRDSETDKLEDRLGEILVCLYEDSERERIAREKREADARRRAEEERKREEQRKRRLLEAERTIELKNKSNDYRIATEIRAYIEAALERGGEEITLEWIDWARRKADWYDPTVALEDEYLGKRDHGKSSEEKDRVLQTGPHRNWW